MCLHDLELHVHRLIFNFSDHVEQLLDRLDGVHLFLQLFTVILYFLDDIRKGLF